ncbi:3-oxoadipate enol-lactonase [Tsukamurella tyrosinosolvens]|uniref:bifunctional 3-oxoadipate enol-lactonase/4-carboxymuconolactone decarboxylase PcaDC n=1 Tax=Tsukamurella tyrosinosolvens TaxID=57704 RepID=UPI001CE109C2|nr:3-oxoadipate enol-lactonase [Tsukamurella tyrosinosolvens]MCA4997877.1 3-oxoadipate enol-lactonase [Tsukamurella tyrosinosolvens]
MTVRLAHDVIAGPAGSGTVVLIGSLGSDRTMWNPQIAPLSGVATVITIDHRGHGGSPAPRGPYTIGDLASDVLALLDTLELDRVHLVGLSLGGAVCQWIAIHRPERVASLALLCTAAQFGDPAKWSARADSVRRDGLGSIADSVILRWFTPALIERDPDLLARSREMLSNVVDEGYAACCDALARWDARADLGRISARTLVMAGDQDQATPPDVMSVLAAGIHGAREEVVGPAAHIASIEQAGTVTRLLLEHIGTDLGRERAHAVGTAVRRSVLGDDHVDRSIAATTAFTAPFQDFITRTAWGDVWNRPGLNHHIRRLLTLAILTATGKEHELDMHIRAALRAGVAADELAEVFLHTSIYAGVPNGNRAFAMTASALKESEH